MPSISVLRTLEITTDMSNAISKIIDFLDVRASHYQPVKINQALYKHSLTYLCLLYTSDAADE